MRDTVALCKISIYYSSITQLIERREGRCVFRTAAAHKQQQQEGEQQEQQQCDCQWRRWCCWRGFVQAARGLMTQFVRSATKCVSDHHTL
jgi:hypothetical protein